MNSKILKRVSTYNIHKNSIKSYKCFFSSKHDFQIGRVKVLYAYHNHKKNLVISLVHNIKPLQKYRKHKDCKVRVLEFQFCNRLYCTHNISYLALIKFSIIFCCCCFFCIIRNKDIK